MKIRKIFYLSATFLLFPALLLAKTEVEYPALLRSIPPQEILQEASSQQEMFSLFASYAFELLLIISVLLLGVSIVVGGVLYLFSSGDIIRRREAKEKIKSALQGGFIIATSFLLLYTINQQLVLFHQEELEESREVMEEDYDEWEVIDTYFQIPSGLLVEDAILNSVAQNKLHDVANATQRAEESATNIEEGSGELLEIIRSCPRGEHCCGSVEQKEDEEIWDSVIQEHGKMDEREQWLGMAEKALEEQKRQKEMLSPEEKAQLEEYKQLIKEEKESVKEEKKHLEEATEHIKEETGEKLPTPPTGGVDEDALIEAVLEAEERLAELNADPDYLHNPELREEGSGLRGKMNLWEEELMNLGYSSEEIEKIKEDHMRDVQIVEDGLLSGAEIDFEEMRERQKEEWHKKSEWQKSLDRGLQRVTDLLVYGVLRRGEIDDGVMELSFREEMFGEGYTRKPQNTSESIIAEVGGIIPYAIGTSIIPVAGPAAYLGRGVTPLARGLGLSPRVTSATRSGVQLFASEAIRDGIWVGGMEFMRSDGTVGENIWSGVREGLISGTFSLGVRGIGSSLGRMSDGGTLRFADDIHTFGSVDRRTLGTPSYDDLYISQVRTLGPREAARHIESSISRKAGKPVRIVSLENMRGPKDDAAALAGIGAQYGNNIPNGTDVVIYGHGVGSGYSGTWRPKGSNTPMHRVISDNLEDGQSAWVVSCEDHVDGRNFLTSTGVLHRKRDGILYRVEGGVETPVHLNVDTGVEDFSPRTVDDIEIELGPERLRIDSEDLYPQKVKDEYLGLRDGKRGLSVISASLFDIFQIGRTKASTTISCNWYMPDARPGGAVHSPDSECTASRPAPMYECYCFIKPEEEEIIEEEEEEEEEEEIIEEEEEEWECPPCPDIAPQVQEKIGEIEGDMGEFEERLETLLSTKEPIEEDLYHLYKMMMLKSLGHRQVIGYNSLLLERRYREKEEVVIDTYMEQSQVGDYTWDWSQWIDNILYKIETEESIIEENDPTTFYLRRPEGNETIEDALMLAKEAKKEGVQKIEEEWGSENISLKKEHFGNFFVTTLSEILSASLLDRTLSRNDEEVANLPGEVDIDPEELTTEEMEEILEKLDSDSMTKEPGDYLSCGMEIPIGEVFELTWDHLMEILDLIDEYEKEGKRLIEQQAKMNDLASPCSCDCRRDFCPSFCGQCDLTCNLGAIESAHQDVLSTRKKLLEIAESIELLTVGHFNSPTENICDSLNKDIRSEEEKDLCYNGGSELITKHELISRKLNYSRFEFDECMTRPEHLEDFLEGRRAGKVPMFGPLAEEDDLTRYTKTEKEGVLINTSEFNWFCCSGSEQNR